MQNMHLEKLFEDLNHPITTEIDILGLETRARQKVYDMVHPLVEQMEGDRETRARIEVHQDRLISRIEKCEEMLGLNKSLIKPKFAEEIDNKIADLAVK